ncbi:MAG: hypothetical protein MUC92_06850 [Fimbriimonadaceae bacterium]|jgi:hypothetical protein|nr:hypothetical protein [Fimbriimonadaceae bacterium]
MRYRIKRTSGFTLVEGVMSAGISVVVATFSLGMMVTSLQTSRAATMESEQVQETRNGVDRMLADARVSDRVLASFTADHKISTTEKSVVFQQPILGPTGIPISGQYRIVAYRIEKIKGKDTMKRYETSLPGSPKWSVGELLTNNVKKINLKYGSSVTLRGDGSTKVFTIPSGYSRCTLISGDAVPINLTSTAQQAKNCGSAFTKLSDNKATFAPALASGKSVTLYFRLAPGHEGTGPGALTCNQLFIELKTERTVKGKRTNAEIKSAALLQSRR